MSLRALPILFINLGGEMMYILDQRLTAQSIPTDKADKVLNDIIGTMLNSQFVEELFRPQPLYSKAALKTAFEKLAHASIMRLNTSSMDKLYDLIVMALKFQLLMCPRPSDIFLITLNHVDAIRNMASSDQVRSQTENLYDHLIKGYGDITEGEFHTIRYEMLNFFQDTHIRVSMFLKDKSQNPNGRFVVPTTGCTLPVGTEIPGTIRLFDSSGTMHKTTHFQTGGQYHPASISGGKERNGNRGTSLGTNMYSSMKSNVTTHETTMTLQRHSSDAKEEPENPALAKAELNFLAQLIGNSKNAPEKAEFRLHLFDFNSQEEPSVTKPSSDVRNVLEVTPTKSNDELVKIMGEMESTSLNESNQRDLLDLMDGVCNYGDMDE